MLNNSALYFLSVSTKVSVCFSRECYVNKNMGVPGGSWGFLGVPRAVHKLDFHCLIYEATVQNCIRHFCREMSIKNNLFLNIVDIDI